MDSAKYFAQKIVAIFQIVAADLALQQIFEGELKRQKKRDTFATAFILTEHNFLNKRTRFLNVISGIQKNAKIAFLQVKVLKSFKYNLLLNV